MMKSDQRGTAPLFPIEMLIEFDDMEISVAHRKKRVYWL